jgi:hypothetical protein
MNIIERWTTFGRPFVGSRKHHYAETPRVKGILFWGSKKYRSMPE